MSHTRPRTAGSRPNRLIQETSPYLLQHAYNPVDWYPWGEDAFARARAEDKPVFLSVGYSACHWCHVMEHESFENPEIAALMNAHYVNVKVDREERPDLDQIYMTAVQLLTRRGGWPMSVFLTPEGEPFYGGTYWPPTSRTGMLGFRDVLQQLHHYWVHRRDEVTSSATELCEAVRQVSAPEFAATPLDEHVLRRAEQALLRAADRRYGGFGGAPKFPHPMDVRVLLRCWRRFGDPEAIDVVGQTLEKMALGGIYDHLGGGFHRYATDVRWLVPHFEKMLYDNALLVPAYLEYGQVLRSRSPRAEEPWPFRVVRETLDYVLREMQQPEGGFSSTQDADSDGEEGKFFVWTEQEVLDVLGAEDARLFNATYDVTSQGNWEGRTILNRPKTHDHAAAILGVSEAALEEVLARCRTKLLAARSQRIPPGRDDKVLVAWNGWMISALATSAQVLREPRFADAAVRAAEFLLSHVRDEHGHLQHSFTDGRARFTAYLDDYAALIEGLVDLYGVTFDPRHLAAARELAGQMIDRFADRPGDSPPSAGHSERAPAIAGFFYTPHDHEPLIARTKDSQDNATPSGNAQAATALLKLGRICGDPSLRERAGETLETLSGLLSEHPRASGQGLLALDALLGPTIEITLAEGHVPGELDEWLTAVHQGFLPNTLVAVRRAGWEDATLPEPLRARLRGREPRDGRMTAFVCRDQSCGPPLTSRAELAEVLRTLWGPSGTERAPSAE